MFLYHAELVDVATAATTKRNNAERNEAQKNG